MVLKQVHFTPHQKQALDECARLTGVKATVVLRWALDAYLQKNLPGYQPEFIINSSEQPADAELAAA